MTKARLVACGLVAAQGLDERIETGALSVTSTGWWGRAAAGDFGGRGAVTFCWLACQGDSFDNTKTFDCAGSDNR